MIYRGSLHFHAPITGVLNPYLLQTVLHSPMFAKAIATVYDSMVTTELPLHMHIEYLLDRNKAELKGKGHNYAAKIPAAEDILMHANKCAVVKNIHSSFHTDSCVNKFLPYCRLENLSFYINYIFCFFLSHIFMQILQGVSLG